MSHIKPLSSCLLKEVVIRLQVLDIAGYFPETVTGISQDSRAIKPGNIFVARSGQRVRGLDFVETAKKNGAVLVITDDELPEDPILPMVRVSNIKLALRSFTLLLYKDYVSKLNIIGLTGTKGKTSSTILLRAVLEFAGYPTGLIGTIHYDNGVDITPAPNTTPDVDVLHNLFAEMVDNELSHCVMEVSSHALELGRVDGISISIAGFLNLSREHLDMHNTMEAYFLAKKRMFDSLDENAIAVVNFDSPYGERIVHNCKAKRIIFFSKSIESGADVIWKPVRQDIYGSEYNITFGETQFNIVTPLVGTFQGENLALVVSIALGMGIPVDVIRDGIAAVKCVPGRMEAISQGQPFGVYCDYAHAPEPLEQVISSTRGFCKGRIITLFGCGGDRDRGKRPIMGRIAAEKSDLVIITSDNSRSEEPADITRMIVEGIPAQLMDKVTVEIDRRKAIEIAISMAQAGDVVLIAGKGHETYQEEKGVRHSFDDRLVAAEQLRLLGWYGNDTQPEA